MWCRGIRGATSVVANTRDEILAATKELLQEIVDSNQVEKEAVACVFFTTTADLNAEFPALAARKLGWREVPLLCCQEINVPDSMPRCIRILVLINTQKRIDEINHIYLRGTEILRREPES